MDRENDTQVTSTAAAEAALAEMDQAIERDPGNLALYGKMAWALVAAEESQRLERLLAELNARFPEKPAAFILAAQIYRQLARHDEAVAASERASKLAPDHLGLLCVWAEDLIRAGRPAEALALIESVPDGGSLGSQLQLRLLVAAARALDVLGDEAGAIERYQLASFLDAKNPTVINRLSIYDQEHGHWPQSRPLLGELQELSTRSLPETLAGGLAALWDEARQPRLPLEGMAWAWKLADRGAWVWEEWRSAAVWGFLAANLLRDWSRWKPDKADEILALIDPPDFSPIREALSEGRGSVVAGAHVGPTAAGVEYFRGTGHPFARLAFAGHERAVDDERDKAILTTTNQYSSVRALIGALQAGSVVGWTVDTSFGDTYSIDFLGRKVRFAAAAPRIVARYAAASFWCQPLWRGDRITIEIDRLPDPVENEPAAAWSSRWYGACLEKLAPVMRGDPRNLVLSSGLWHEPHAYQLFGARRALRWRSASKPLAVEASG